MNIEENLESSLSALVDYLCGYGIADHNRKSLVSRYMGNDFDYIVVKGGKAINRYIEADHRPESFDWDATIFTSRDTPIESEERDVFRIIDSVRLIIENLFNDHMKVAPLTIQRAVYTETKRKRNAFNNRKSKQLYDELVALEPLERKEVPKITFSSNTRVSKLSGTTVGYIDLVYRGVKLFTMYECNIIYSNTPERVKYLDDALNSLDHCVLEYGKIFDRRRPYLPLKELEEDLRYLVSDESTYPKKPKALERLRLIDEARCNDHIVCNDPLLCTKKLVYDLTDSVPGFEIKYAITEETIAQWCKFIERHKTVEYAPITEYSKNSNINMALIKSFYFNSELKAKDLATVNAIDGSFDYFAGALPIDPLPTVLYRFVRYLDPPRRGVDDAALNTNLYKAFVPGVVFPAINYTSATWNNNNSAMSPFNNESHFRGILFFITIESNEGLIVMGKHSRYEDENEILLHRKGGFRVDRAEYKYVAEGCGSYLHVDKPVAVERLIVHCTFIPPSKMNEIVISEPLIQQQGFNFDGAHPINLDYLSESDDDGDGGINKDHRRDNKDARRSVTKHADPMQEYKEMLLRQGHEKPESVQEYKQMLQLYGDSNNQNSLQNKKNYHNYDNSSDKHQQLQSTQSEERERERRRIQAQSSQQAELVANQDNSDSRYIFDDEDKDLLPSQQRSSSVVQQQSIQNTGETRYIFDGAYENNRYNKHSRYSSVYRPRRGAGDVTKYPGYYNKTSPRIIISEKDLAESCFSPNDRTADMSSYRTEFLSELSAADARRAFEDGQRAISIYKKNSIADVCNVIDFLFNNFAEDYDPSAPCAIVKTKYSYLYVDMPVYAMLKDVIPAENVTFRQAGSTSMSSMPIRTSPTEQKQGFVVESPQYKDNELVTDSGANAGFSLANAKGQMSSFFKQFFGIAFAIAGGATPAMSKCNYSTIISVIIVIVIVMILLYCSYSWYNSKYDYENYGNPLQSTCLKALWREPCNCNRCRGVY